MVELDGGQHYEETGKEKDRLRDDALTRMGLKIFRFSDRDIFEDITAVLERIWSHL